MFLSTVVRRCGRSAVRQFSSGVDIKTVSVVGLGSMGHGVAQLCASSGYNVVAVDINDTVMKHAQQAIEGSLLKLASKKAAKEGTDEEAAKAAAYETLGRIQMTSDVGAVADTDLVIEAIVENLPVKKKFFGELGGIVAPHTILASNTSSFPITEMAVASNVAERVCGIHYFNPVQLMKLVEVVSTEYTRSDIADAMVDFVKVS